MAKSKHKKRYECFGHHRDPKRAECNAMYLANAAWTRGVKVICDDGCFKETLVIKAEE